MVSWAIKEFGGEIPKKESRLLPDYAAEEAWNCDLASGVLEGLPAPTQVIDLSGGAGNPNGTQRAYRFPLPGLPDTWLPLPDPNSSVCRSPEANDQWNRIYWTNPGNDANPGAYWNTQARIASGNSGSFAPYNLGTIQPSTTYQVTATAVGGSATSVARTYCFTYVNVYGEESAPNLPSNVVTGPSDATWTVTGLPTVAPSNPSGFNYPAIATLNVYRTSTGANSGAQFYLIQQLSFTGANSPWVDGVSDLAAVGSLVLPSASWANPPTIDGLTAMPGGMLVAFNGNTVWFCEPDHPHTWPAGYAQSLQYQIMGFGVWQQSLVVLTEGFPSTGSGNSPSNFVFTQVRVPEPCIARASIVTDLMGVYYASQNGLVMLNYFGMQNQTLSSMTKNIWLADFFAQNILACRHRAQYLAINGTGTGFLIDYSDQKMGVVHLSTFENVTAIWNDEYTGNAYMCAGGVIYLWDSPIATQQVYRWRSKQFYGIAPVNIGAAQVSLDPDILTATQPPTPPLSNGDASLILPAGALAVFNLYAGPDGENLVYSRVLKEVREIFSLPSGFKSFDWQCEIISCVGVRSIELASTMRELRDV
jgi:hypothetical protein